MFLYGGLNISGVGKAVAYAAFIINTAIIVNYKLDLRKVMAKKKVYDEVSVVRALSKKASVYVNTVEKRIDIIKNNTELGNGSWGKIDYLTNVHGYIPVFVSNISSRKSIKKFTDTDLDNVRSKASKREAKLNMAAMSKAAMKRVKTK